MMNACNSSKNSTETENPKEVDMPFVTAKNYFVKNTFQDGSLSTLKLSNQADFDSIFGMATVMGSDGKPTAIDFSKQYAVSIIGSTTDKENSISINSLKKSDSVLVLEYKLIEGEKQSFSIRPFALIFIDNSYQGSLKFIKK